MYEKIQKENIKPKHYNEGTQKIKCPSCQPHNHSPKDNPLSFTINNGSAVWNCHHCEYKGAAGSNNFVTAPKKVFVTPVQPKEPQTPSTMFTYFAERGISKETVVKKDIYIDEKVWIAFPYKDENSKVVNIKYRTRDKKFKQSPNAVRTLYNYDMAKDKDVVIFVEGEMDVLTCIEAGFDNVVSLPDGAPAEAKFKEHDARFTALTNCPLEAKKIILFTDNDTAGKSLHSELLHRFGKDMCWYVDYPSDCKDANEVLLKHGAERLRDIINSAAPYPVDGLYTANEYYGAVLDLYNGNYVKPIEVGYTNLDDI